MTDDALAAHGYHATAYGVPMAEHATILDALRYRALDCPNEPYLTAVAADGGQETITFAQLAARSAIAALWVRGLGVRPADVVGLVPTNDVLSVVTLYGILRTGATALILSPTDPPLRIDEQARAQSAAVLIRSPHVRPGPPGISLVSMSEQPGSGDAGKWSDPDLSPLSDAVMLGTSGSTSASKIVVQSQHNIVTNAEAVRRHHGLRGGQRLLSFLPIYHANALNLALFGTLYAGAHAVLPHGFDPLRAGRVIEQTRPRIISVAPTILEALLQTWRDPDVPEELEHVVSAAAPLTADTARAVRERWRVPVLQGYGLTETTNFSTTVPCDLPAEVYREMVTDAAVPSIGVALYGNEVSVRTAAGEPVVPGAVGEICIRGHNVMDRYAGNPAATAEAFRGGWFHTGDLGYSVGRSGREFFFVTGRIKNIAKVRGEMVSLDEVDRALRAVPGVRDAACVRRQDRLTGDSVVAAVCFVDAPVDVLAALRERIPAVAVPSRIVVLPMLPRSRTGKLLRPDLAAKLDQLITGAEPTAVVPGGSGPEPPVVGTFSAAGDPQLTRLRRALLEGGRVLPAAPEPVATPADPAAVGAELTRQLAVRGIAVVSLPAPLGVDAFIELGHRLGRPVPERDPAVQPYVARGVVLNLVMSGGPTDDVALQPFAGGPLSLHSEGSGRPVSRQFRFIVLMCRERSGPDSEFQTVLVPMAQVARALLPRQLDILRHTRYHGQPEAPTIARDVGGRVVFAFRDFVDSVLHWECTLGGATEAEVNDTLAALTRAMYAPAVPLGLTWSAGTVAVIDNTWFFHGRSAGRFLPGAGRHLARLRLLEH
ncbi:AMP-binding protein [Micromonospora sp. CPCC 206060]|uniref:AMP-binding protein n=1 Tax=Micromonospora sp. CPCC 206060 TaxID=3122406 RepID=UPI002FF1C8F4